MTLVAERFEPLPLGAVPGLPRLPVSARARPNFH